MKRKHEATNGASNGAKSKVLKTETNIKDKFHSDLFSPKTVESYKKSYAESTPYLHTVVQPLISDQLLRSVRQEILDNIHFTPKETDIYKIHQSGDLANLSGLPDDALKRLPSLLQLRDAMYSPDFRAWVTEVSGSGALSGKKTDMAVNVYTPGCHLLCHDDVIGSRRVSYILYLTNPDIPWKDSWGGALRLYPTNMEKAEDGKELRIPHHEWSKIIPPAWNQLSFFTVQPGHSFHDVEEVYKRAEGESEEDGGRVRMAISGWFHIPQEGEEGYEPGLEEKLAERSSLQQLQGKDDALDLPQPKWIDTAAQDEDETADQLTEKDLDFLLKFMTPHYLTPDTVDELSTLFLDESSLQLANLLSKKFSERLKTQIEASDQDDELTKDWQTARPPHKHRYKFKQPKTGESNSSEHDNALCELYDSFLPSRAFSKWLSLATGLTLGKSNILARRFRRGLDYTLATAHEDSDAQLEWCLNLTPSKGWIADEETEAQDGEAQSNGTNGFDKKKGKQPDLEGKDEEDNVGGYELYMAGDDADDDDDAGSDHGIEIPAGASATGGGNRRVVKQKKADPAIYKASMDEEDDGILFSNPAAWNTMSIVLRDQGTLKFVKYVSKAAEGDRWDITGSVQVLDDDDDDEEDGDADVDGSAGAEEDDDEEEDEDEAGDEDAQEENGEVDGEEEWKGFKD
ncbi:hypothetical protein MBLNU457_g0686t1 [Dothideomycetes sp. NU457]